jgi:adenylate cyclase
MTSPLKLQIHEDGQCRTEVELTGLLELGRQRVSEPEPYTLLEGSPGNPARLIFASTEEVDNVSRQHLELEPLADGSVRVTNRSRNPLWYGDQRRQEIPSRTTTQLFPPFSLILPRRVVSVRCAASPDEGELHHLMDRTLPPGSVLGKPTELFASLGSDVPESKQDELVRWLQTSLAVLQSTVGSAEFLDKATQALVEVVGLDLGQVLLLTDGEWTVGTIHRRPNVEPGRPSQRVLKQVLSEKRTFWFEPQQFCNVDGSSWMNLRAVVASPILDAQGGVLGVLYGERRAKSPLEPAFQAKMSKLEATIVELLACGIATGLARQEQERAAVQNQVRFEQFFGPQLARQLAQDQDLLEHGREAEVTLLFADVRRFSAFSEKLGPTVTLRWINQVMERLSECVLAEEGVLVDYIGDEIIAMWGAPFDQEDQASRAVRAALAIRDALPDLNARWKPILEAPMDLGIGINTGRASVGNTGSRYRFKYGPLGNTVNVASRVQGLTKPLQCPLLITGSTQEKVCDSFITRRVCKTRMRNILGPVDVYEVAGHSEERATFFQESESALQALESKKFTLAARQAGALLDDHPEDGPLRLILARAADMLVKRGAGFDPVWDPRGS